MPKDYAALPPNQVRRSDNAVDDETWIRALLHRAPIGTLATVHQGLPFINTNLFVYDESRHEIYMHTARVGRTQANVTETEQICFSVNEMGRLLPADTALEFSVEYASVVIFGNASIIFDDAEATHALQLLLNKYFPQLHPGTDYHPITRAELARTAVYRIQIDSWSGKKEEADADFPGAFRYGSQDTLSQ